MTNPAELVARAVEREGAAQHPAELAQLVTYLAERPLVGVIEIGVYKGGTLWLWRELGAEQLIGIDKGIVCRDCNLRRAHDGCPWNRIVATEAQFLERDSQLDATAAFVRDLIGPEGIDFLHIDGDHSHAAVRRDFQLYAPLVRSGGTIALHDVVSYEGVAEFWAESLAGLPGTFVIHEPPVGMGFGIVPAGNWTSDV